MTTPSSLEGAPDPFPSLSDSTPARSVPTTSKASPRQTPLDTSSQTSFPSLAPASAPAVAPRQAPTISSWASASPRIKAPISRAFQFSESISIPDIDLSQTGKEGKRLTLGEVLKDIQAKTKTKIEASTQKKETTFHFKADSEKDLDKAKKLLTSAVSPNITLKVEAPVSSIGTIIGPKGATLKQIRDKTNVRIDIPRKDASPVNGNGIHTNHHIGDSSDEEEQADEPTVTITIFGPSPLAHEARSLLLSYIGSKPVKPTKQKVKDVPAHILPFIKAHFASWQQEGVEVTVTDGIILIQGDRELVARTSDAVKATVKQLSETLSNVTLKIPKKQHRLLVGDGADDIMKRAKCAVVVTSLEDSDEDVKVWGKQEDLPNGLMVTMQKANSRHIQTFTFPAHATLVHAYVNRTNYLKTLLASRSSTEAFLNPPSIVAKTNKAAVDFVGDKAEVDSAIKELVELTKKLEGGIKEVEIDWLTHKVLLGRFGKKIKQFHETHNALLFFPPDQSESSFVLLVYDPSPAAAASTSPAQKTKILEEVHKEVDKLAAEAADVKNEVLNVDKRWHAAIVGKAGTTLNAIIGEEKTLSIKVGSQAKLGPGQAPLADDVILIRGPSNEVDRAAREIRNIVDKAQNDEIDNGHTVEFDIVREYVGRVVGAHGTGLNRLRDELGVRVDLSDDGPEEKKEEKDGSKKSKKPASGVPKSKVKIVGRKENVEEAKKRILAQVDRLADETSEILRIARQYHPSLIGQGGKYVIRLEEKYSVKITFPRDSAGSSDEQPNGNVRAGDKTRENLKPDEVIIKGGKKGVADAKAEILEAVEYEKDTNHPIKFTVPTRAVARILGKGGVNITEIKDSTDTQIDIDKASEGTSGVTNITVRGTKKAAEAAKKAIMAVADQVDDEVSINVDIEARYHRTIIGVGGQTLKELVTRCGGPSDPKAQAGLIHFPRAGESPNEVRLRGPRELVKKLQAELEKISATYKDRVVLGVSIPAVQHRQLIGRGGQHLTDLQNRTGATVQFPGSRSYAAVGEPENAADLADVEAPNLVKVYGPREACEKAIEEMTTAKFSPDRSNQQHETFSSTIQVPLKYYHVISQQGNFFRNLRSNLGVSVDHSKQPEKPAAPPRPSTTSTPSLPLTRIDDEEETSPLLADIQWQVVPNYADAEEGDADWILKARDQPALERAEQLLNEAISHAQGATHIGYLTLSDRTVFPRIVGTKGANVARLRAETEAEITVGRDDNTIVIIGSEQALEAAKSAIIDIASNYRPRGA